MGLTLTEKILKAHLVEGEYVKGQEIGIRIDQTLTQDATGRLSVVEDRQHDLWAYAGRDFP